MYIKIALESNATIDQIADAVGALCEQVRPGDQVRRRRRPCDHSPSPCAAGSGRALWGSTRGRALWGPTPRKQR
jgi:hypothetical protein